MSPMASQSQQLTIGRAADFLYTRTWRNPKKTPIPRHVFPQEPVGQTVALRGLSWLAKAKTRDTNRSSVPPGYRMIGAVASQQLFLIDTFGFIFRAYHARARSGAPPMRTSTGFSTEAVYI